MAIKRDPRPDLTDDSKLWDELLEMTKEDENLPEGLYGSLIGMRIEGARLEVKNNMVKLLKGEPGEGELQDWPDLSEKEQMIKWRERYAYYRGKYLLPHQKKLKFYLARLTKMELEERLDVDKGQESVGTELS
jgi:hypothetical protein